MPIIDDIHVRETRCKNDNCRKLFGYERIKSGIQIFICPRCEETSVFRINYSKGQENIDQLSDMINPEERG
jgi:hypothetical protein